MTTSQSPLRVLKAQADEIARHLRAFERGEKVPVEWAIKIQEAKTKNSIVIGVVMDDKVLKLTLPWSIVQKTPEIALAAYILKQMRGERDAS